MLRFWTEHKRVTSPAYFPRYFAYAIPNGEIPDVPVANFITRLPLPTLDQAVDAFYEVAGDRTADTVSKLLTKLSHLTGQVDDPAARQLIPALARIGNTSGIDQIFLPYLVAQLTDQIAVREARADVAAQALDEAKKPLYKHYLLGAWEPSPEDIALDKELLPDAALPHLREQIIAPIRESAKQGPLYLTLPGEDALLHLRIWSWHSTPNEAQRHLEEIFGNDPAQAADFLLRVAPQLQAATLEGSVGADLQQRSDHHLYGNIAEVIPPARLTSFLRETFGGKLDSPPGDGDGEVPAEERVARRFVALFKSSGARSGGDAQPEVLDAADDKAGGAVGEPTSDVAGTGVVGVEPSPLPQAGADGAYRQGSQRGGDESERVERVRQLRDSVFRDESDGDRPLASLEEIANTYREMEAVHAGATEQERLAMRDSFGDVAQLFAFSGGDPDALDPDDGEPDPGEG